MIICFNIFVINYGDVDFSTLVHSFTENSNNNKFVGPMSTFRGDLDIFDVYSFWPRKHIDYVIIDGEKYIIFVEKLLYHYFSPNLSGHIVGENIRGVRLIAV